jgi:lipopolysaccharide/colanic/teichoic acid biosynthesis glycosyltransferase
MTTELLNDVKSVDQLQDSSPNRFLDIEDDRWSESKKRGYLKFKYFFESFVAVCLLAVLWPVILVLWLAVKATSPGTGFYTQSRVGLGGKVFKVVKLRSMCLNAELGGKCRWSNKADRRITPLGKILRKLHLDELPQLWNVACGEMSLVGPRPERPEITVFLEQRIPRYHSRHRVKPGITGLAQVNLEPDEHINSTRKKQILDLRYIQNSSISLDLRLLFATSLRVIGIPGSVAMKVARLEQEIHNDELHAVGYEFDTSEEELWSPSKEFR